MVYFSLSRTCTLTGWIMDFACIIVECYLLVPQVLYEINPAVIISDVVSTDPSCKSHSSRAL